jgi:D-alanyl-D-alanine carboxypeptidase (penicillin-binding protein 5/6)
MLEKTETVQRRRNARLLVAAFVAILSWSPGVGSIETTARHAVLLDATTNTVLFAKNANMEMIPASMTKMMTAHLVFENLRDGRLSLDDTFVVSENAWRKGGAKSGSSTMFLEPRSRARVEDLLRGIIIQSGNDACIVMAEGLSGSESAFAEEMNRRARTLGLTKTTFKNTTGWPEEGHVSTAHDLAILAKNTLQTFPEFLHFYSEKSFTYNGIKQGNRNPLLYRDPTVDGLKTGHTKKSGYGLTASAKRGDRRLILVVNGLNSIKKRSRESERLLEWGFREFDNYGLFAAGEKVTNVDVWLGREATVPLIIKEELLITMPRKSRRSMKVKVTYENPVPAPIIAGTKIATLTIEAPDTSSRIVPLFAGTNVERLGLIGRLGEALKYILWGSSS